MTEEKIIIKCKDIPDQPILEFLLINKGNWCNWHFEDENINSIDRTQDDDEKIQMSLERNFMKSTLIPDKMKSFSTFPPSIFKRTNACTKIQRGK